MTTHSTDQAPAFMNAKEVAAWLHVSERQIWRMLDAGLIPQPLKFGGASRFSAATLQAWIDAGAKPVRPAINTTSMKGR